MDDTGFLTHIIRVVPSSISPLPEVATPSEEPAMGLVDELLPVLLVEP
jgi:hypothetical protein